MSFPSIINRGEFFSDHYLESVIASDLNDLRQRWGGEGDVRQVRSHPGHVPSVLPSSWRCGRAGARLGHGHRSCVERCGVGGAGFEADRTGSSWPRPATRFRSRPPIWPRRRRVPVGGTPHFATDVDELFGATGDDDAVELVGSIERSADNKRVRIPAMLSVNFRLRRSPRYVLVVAGPVACWPNGPVGLRGAFWRSISMALSSATTPRPRVSWRRSPPCSRLMCSLRRQPERAR